MPNKFTLIQRIQKRVEKERKRARNRSRPIYLPATQEQVVKAERLLGFELPELLRQLYLQVGNGGFGPGYGLISLPGGATDDGDSLIDRYHRCRTVPDDDEPEWPKGLLMVCHWGCAIYSSVDCARPEAPIIRHDPNVAYSEIDDLLDENQRWPEFGRLFGASWFEAPSLEVWLEAWLEEKPLFFLGHPKARWPDSCPGETGLWMKQ